MRPCIPGERGLEQTEGRNKMCGPIIFELEFAKVLRVREANSSAEYFYDNCQI